MSKLVFTAFLVSLVVTSTTGRLKEQQSEYTKQAELDAQGNIYVSSDQGKLIWMANTKHCSEVSEATDHQTVGCRVMQDQELGNTMPSLQLEIYRKGGHKEIIEPGASILDWHFWKDGQQVAVSSGLGNGQATYALYDSATGHLIEKLSEPADEGLLPQWAKTGPQIQDESVPMSAELTQDRRQWIAKVLRQIGKIKPGMRRKDLLKVFTTEGGISARTQRTYVHTECPYIKVNVRFRVVSNESLDLNEDPDDIIESVSQPYLAWTVID
jgi:hypothetical protein